MDAKTIACQGCTEDSCRCAAQTLGSNVGKPATIETREQYLKRMDALTRDNLARIEEFGRQEPADAGSKPSNPKDIVAQAKVPMHLWPTSATALGSIGLYEGMLKYGYVNWRAHGVRASVYVSALQRHMAAWFEGEEFSAEGVPHLANALACLAIIVDAQAHKKLMDDRPLSYMDSSFQYSKLQESVKQLQKNFGSVNPHHYTQEESFRKANGTGQAN